MRYTSHDPEHAPHGLGRVLRWALWDRLLGRRRPAPPGPPAPRIEGDRHLAAERRPPGRLTWLGHASFLGVLGGAAFLLDPVLSRRVGLFYRRHGAPGLELGELPELDVLMVSHSHYDHLDAPTVEGLSREVAVVVPLGLGSFFRHRGFRRVRELDWWQTAEEGALRLTLVPARHWSRRTPWDTNRSLWGGFVVEGGGLAVYHAGDSGDFPGFDEIGRRFPRLAAAMLPIGAYDPPWFMEPNHMSPEQAGRAFLRLGARRLVPMHWGTFQLTDEPLAEPAERLLAWWRQTPGGAIAGRELAQLAVGETLLLEPSRSTALPGR